MIFNKFQTRKRRSSSLRNGLDLAPLLDIIFILVTYFLVNASFLKQPSLNIDLPKSIHAKADAKQALQIYINNKKEIYLNKTLVKEPLLSTKVMALIKERPYLKLKARVILYADKTTPYEKLLSVMDELYKAGMKDFRLGTKF